MDSFERVLRELTRGLLAASPSEMAGFAQLMLERSCDVLGTDRAVFGHVDGAMVHTRFVWERQLQYPPPDTWAPYPWLVSELSAGRDVVLRQLPDSLPPDAAAERAYVERSGLRAHVTLPIIVSGKFLWSISTSCFDGPRDWSERDVERLRVLGGGLAAAAERVELNSALATRRSEVEELRREVEHAGRLSTAGDLATSLAHEVSQPLTAIVSNAQAGKRFLAGGQADPAVIAQILEDIAQQGQRANEVIQRLREFLAKSTPRRESLDLNELVRGILPLLRGDILDREIELGIELPDLLPSVSGDRVQLQQVVVNLIQNACEALQATPAPRRLELCSGRSDDGVEFSVSDNGPGVPPENATRIFEPFVSTKATGMGLGLSICRSLVEAHGGTLTMQGSPGGGARFIVQLPAGELP